MEEVAEIEKKASKNKETIHLTKKEKKMLNQLLRTV
jgi:hypothetical protein